MKEKYSLYEFRIIACKNKLWSYEIEGEDGVIESNDYFDTKQEARFAVIGHIDLLENGGYCD